MRGEADSYDPYESASLMSPPTPPSEDEVKGLRYWRPPPPSPPPPPATGPLTEFELQAEMMLAEMIEASHRPSVVAAVAAPSEPRHPVSLAALISQASIDEAAVPM